MNEPHQKMIAALAGLPQAEAILLIIQTAYPMLVKFGVDGGPIAASTSIEHTMLQITEHRRFLPKSNG